MDQPSTLAEIDAQLDKAHRGEDAAIDSCQGGVRDYWVFEIQRLENLRRIVASGSDVLDVIVRERRRHVAARYAAAEWAGDRDTADRLRAELDRLERGQA